MNDSIADSPSSPEGLIPVMEKLLKARNGLDALEFLKLPENRVDVFTECGTLIHMIMAELNDDFFRAYPSYYCQCEDILKLIADEADVGEVVLELLDVIDVTHSDNTVVSILKAMQVCLLRDSDGASRPLEWCLNSIQSYVSELPLSMELRHRLDTSETHVEDEKDQIRRIVSFYYFLFLFYEPVLDQIVTLDVTTQNIFRENEMSRRNVLASFIIQLFAEPIGFFDLSIPLDAMQIGPTQMNNHIQDCMNSLTNHFTRLMTNPLRLIAYGERRHRWPYVLPCADEAMNARPTLDIFVIEEKAPFLALSIMFYVFIGENRLPANTPKIYEPIYLFEMGLYYANHLISKPDEAYRTKGIKLALKLLDNLQREELGDETLELDIHRFFSTNLINVLDTTRVRKNSKAGVELFQKYINKFKSTEAKLYHIRHLFTTTDNKKIHGFLIVIYKNIIALLLNRIDANPRMKLPDCCRGEALQYILEKYACILPDGLESDIVKNSDIIVAGLNVLRFLVIRDKRDLTELWASIRKYEVCFLNPLRDALECSRTQFKLEEQRIKEKKTPDLACQFLVDGEDLAAMADENRLQALQIGRNTFDLIESLLTRVQECIEVRQIAEREE